ncbi:MAG: nitroreductase family deazaflavin-dependent oxidoreductase [Ilumatobacter sp.]
MPVPHVVARVNKRFTNRFIEPIVRRGPGYAVVHHTGRLSGEAYRTPLYVFDLDGHPLVVLTYGQRADWLRNAGVGVCRLERRHRLDTIESIEVVGRSTARPGLPWLVRGPLRLLRVRDFAVLHLSDALITSPPATARESSTG